MKKQMKLVFVLMLVFATALTGCGKDSGLNIAVGSWNGNVFENTWLNMKFTSQEGWTISSDEEIAEATGIDTKELDVLKKTDNKAKKAAAKLKTIYGFMTSDPEGTMRTQLIYDNLALSKKDTKCTEKEYLDSISKSLLELDGGDYKVVEETTEEIAGKTFQCLKMSGSDGEIFQDYYCYKKDKCMVTLLCVYSKDEKASKDEFIKNISVLEEK